MSEFESSTTDNKLKLLSNLNVPTENCLELFNLLQGQGKVKAHSTGQRLEQVYRKPDQIISIQQIKKNKTVFSDKCKVSLPSVAVGRGVLSST